MPKAKVTIVTANKQTGLLTMLCTLGKDHRIHVPTKVQGIIPTGATVKVTIQKQKEE